MPLNNQAFRPTNRPQPMQMIQMLNDLIQSGALNGLMQFLQSRQQGQAPSQLQGQQLNQLNNAYQGQQGGPGQGANLAQFIKGLMNGSINPSQLFGQQGAHGNHGGTPFGGPAANGFNQTQPFPGGIPGPGQRFPGPGTQARGPLATVHKDANGTTAFARGPGAMAAVGPNGGGIAKTGCNHNGQHGANDEQLKDFGGGKGWAFKHSDVHKNKDGTYSFKKGELKGCTGKWDDKINAYRITNKDGQTMGKASLSDKGEKSGDKKKLASPLTFDLNGDGVKTVKNGKQNYDIDGDGTKDKNVGWADKNDGVLAFDGNGDGTVGGDGKELLGNNTDVDGDGKKDGHANGFEALKGLAVKHLGQDAIADGKLDANELKALEGKTKLGMMVNGQLKSLGELGISEIKLGYKDAGGDTDIEKNGNHHKQVGAGFTLNGKEGAKVNDVWFGYNKG